MSARSNALFISDRVSESASPQVNKSAVPYFTLGQQAQQARIKVEW